MKKLLVLIVFFLAKGIYAQGVYTNVSDPVYDYLQKVSSKLELDYSGLVRPKLRTDIAGQLLKIDSLKVVLNKTEIEELNWYIEEYAGECKLLTKEKPLSNLKIITGRKRTYSFDDSYFKLNVSPILGYAVTSQYNSLVRKSIVGLNLFSSIGDNWGFFFNFADNSETGNKLDSAKRFTKETGTIIKALTVNNMQYSEARGAVTYSDKSITLSMGKDWMNWGSGYNSRLILSDKAPSFPFIKLDIHPVEWFHFYYYHGWLNSRIDDTNRTYAALTKAPDSSVVQRKVEREKYIAAHILEVTLTRGVKLSLGESLIYSDGNPKLGFFIPVVFFRLVDHYYEGSDGSARGGNAQLFSDLNISYWKNYNFFITSFIDEFSMSQFLKGETGRNQLGFTIGGSVYEPAGINNLTLRTEYTGILPWVYSNFIQTQTYTSSDYLLGHYIGQNSSQIFLQADYKYNAQLGFRLSGDITKNGGFGDINNQYKNIQEPFLYAPVRSETNIGLEVIYEPVHELYSKLKIVSTKISDNDKNRTPLYQIGSFVNIYASLQYGL